MALRDWFWVLVLGGVWGSSFLFNAILIRELDPLWVSAGRITVGALGCWVFLHVTKVKLPRHWKIYGHFLLLGIIGYTIPFTLFPISQHSLASGVAAIINAMTPITTVIVSQFWIGGEKATWSKTAGIIAGFIGVSILASPALAAGGSSELWAIVLCLAATLCYAVSLNYARYFKDLNPTVIATLALSGGALAALVLAISTHGTPRLVTLECWIALIGIGLLATTFAFLLTYRLLPRIGPTNFSIVTFIAPVSSIILGFVFLGETVQLVHILGMIGIFIGLLLIDGRIVKYLRKSSQ